METRELKKSEWRPFFDRLSKNKPQWRVSMKEIGMDLGAHPESQCLTLNGISFDPRSESLDIVADPIDHRIQRPISISVCEGPAGPVAIEVLDGNGVRQILAFQPPKMLRTVD